MFVPLLPYVGMYMVYRYVYIIYIVYFLLSHLSSKYIYIYIDGSETLINQLESVAPGRTFGAHRPCVTSQGRRSRSATATAATGAKAVE